MPADGAVSVGDPVQNFIVQYYFADYCASSMTRLLCTVGLLYGALATGIRFEVHLVQDCCFRKIYVTRFCSKFAELLLHSLASSGDLVAGSFS